jgi:hypothetical protein
MVQVGIYCIMGLGQDSFLSSHLLAELRRNYVMYLFQARGMVGRDFPILIGNWVKNLVWSGSLQRSGRHIKKELHCAGIQLQNKNDELIWAGGDCSGNISAKKLYLALAKNYGQLLLEVGEVIFGNGIWYQRLNSLPGYLWRTKFSLGIFYKGRDGRDQTSVPCVSEKMNLCTTFLSLAALVGRFGVIFTKFLIFRLPGKEFYSVHALRTGIRRKILT